MIKAAEIDELKPGTIKRITADGDAMLLCNVAGEYYAVSDMCSHEDFSLSYGCLKGYDIECSLHGARFDVRTGEPTMEPGDAAIATYPIVFQDQSILIDR